MTTVAKVPEFFDAKFTTPFNNQTSVKNYLIGQTVFSTALGYFVCRLPFVQSVALGLVTEGCRYVTDKAIEQLSSKFTFIRDYKTAVKTAFVAGSFYLAKIAANKVLPGPTTFLGAGLLMIATYLVGEPIVNGITKEEIKNCFMAIKNDIEQKYNIQQYKDVIQKIYNPNK